MQVVFLLNIIIRNYDKLVKSNLHMGLTTAKL
jgi:hypothetical protein